MDTFISVPIPCALFVELVDFLRGQKNERDPVLVVADAVDYWIQNASMKPEILRPGVSLAESRGYTWKRGGFSLFMPHGTDIRMPYKGQYHYAKVEGDEIKYNGSPVSPAALVNAITKSSRNAWRDLWIKRPGETEWVLADDCRREMKSKLQIDTKKLLDELRAPQIDTKKLLDELRSR